MVSSLIDPAERRDVLVYREDHAYCAHPHITVARDGTWVAIFNRAPRKPFVLHPPEEPLYHNVVIRSLDEGATWSAPQVVPAYNWAGTECAGLTALADGRLMLNQWQFDWIPLGAARRKVDQSRLTYPSSFMEGWHTSPEHATKNVKPEAFEEIAPWVRGGGKTFIHFSDDNGASFGEGTEIDTSPFTGGYGMRGAVELSDARIILPLSDVPNYKRVFSVESRDGGRTWTTPVPIGDGDGHEFEEPAILRCRSGKLLIILRDNLTRRLHQAESLDGGASWSTPSPVSVNGYPAHLVQLDDGRILMTYGWRQPDYGIRAVLSCDEGKTWGVDTTIRICGGMLNKNLGYPATIEIESGHLFTIYYGEQPDGVTCILGTYWRL